MSQPARVEESVAEWALGQLLSPVAVVLVDDGSAPGLRDFDLVFPDGRIEPLEVTSAALPQLLAAMSRHRKATSGALSVPGLARRWTVYTSVATDFRALTADALLGLLGPLEAAGADHLFPARDRVSHPTAVQAARAMGIGGAISGAGKPGLVILSPPNDDRPWVSSAADPASDLVAALEVLAHKDDNRRKLKAPPGVDTHLFVVVHSVNYLPWRDVVTGEHPVRGPKLPIEVTTVWAATEVAGQVLCWQYRGREGWQSWILTSPGFPKRSPEEPS